MATTPLSYLNQYFTTFLNVGGGIDNSQTTGIVAQSVSGVDITKPGVACISYSNPIDTSVAEWFKYTSINGSNEFQGVTRGGEGFSAKSHSNQAVIAFPLSESHINGINEMFDTTGLDTAQISTPASPSAGRNKLYFKSDDLPYTLTSGGTEAALTVGTLPVKASGAEITTGTDDAKFVTAKALADATVSKLGAAWTSWTLSPTNLSIGNGSYSAKYTQIGKSVRCVIQIVFGSTTSVSGSITINLPVTAGNAGYPIRLGTASILDSGTVDFEATVVGNGASTCFLNVLGASGTYVTPIACSSTVPMTWAVNDQITMNFTYEAA